MRNIFIVATSALMSSYLLYKQVEEGSSEVHDHEIGLEYHHLFEEWKMKHQKEYQSPEEAKYRLGLFKKTVDLVRETNRRQKDYKLRVNKFSDQSIEELETRYSGLDVNQLRRMLESKQLSAPLTPPEQKKTNFKDTAIPAAIDWREKGAVGPIKDQKDCKADWAFASTAALESAYQLKYNQLESLSEQQLIDCTSEFDNDGCGGQGLVPNTFDYIQQYGITTEAKYPYANKRNSDCLYSQEMKLTGLKGYLNLVGDEGNLKIAVGAYQPVAVALFASPLYYYDSGIFSNYLSCPPSGLNHAMVIVGYGDENGSNYWIAKNSWGTDWGEKGYIRLYRLEYGPGICGLATMPTFPIIE